FSSSTIFANLMAGIMLRVTKPFRTGDFIRVEDHFGRVVERGLLDTEIQTEERDLVALPNTYMITNAVYVTRSSGTIVSTTLSLGYDIHHSQVESLLVEAAKDCELEEPFVQILDLGNHAITYKVSGLLADIKQLLTARSHLRCHVLETLHGNGIEIVSPAFMNQRRLADDRKVIPVEADAARKSPPTVSVPENVVFDKADKAEQAENEKQQLLDQIQQYESDLEEASGEDKKRIEVLLAECEQKVKEIEQRGVEAEPERTGVEKRS
ncbi:MAG: mechanosensitive ion channel domain-containing protein, partial [Thermodesulfobacteriota bacterium]